MVCLAVLAVLLGVVVAPFPESYPYNFLNPAIDPWWQGLDPAEQKQVYSVWEAKEPFLLALADAVTLKKILKKAGIEPQPLKKKEDMKADENEVRRKIALNRKRRALSCPNDNVYPMFVAVEYSDAFTRWLGKQHAKGRCAKSFPME